MRVRDRLGSFARSNTFVYRTWFSFYRRKKSSRPTLPTAGDLLYLDGYPRSGNTYFTAAIKSLYPDINFPNHLHLVAPVKMAARRNVPTFLLIRNPQDALSSFFLHVRDTRTTSSKSSLCDEDLCQSLIVEWLSYYKYAASMIDRIHIISSDSAFRMPDVVVRAIIERSHLPAIPDFEQNFTTFNQKFIRNDSMKAQGSTSFPDPSREVSKEEVKSLLRTFTLFDECSAIYDTLKEKSIIDVRSCVSS